MLEQLAIAAGAMGAGSTLTAVVNKWLNRRGDRIDILERLERLSQDITDRALAHSNERVTSAELRARLAEQQSETAKQQVETTNLRFRELEARMTEREVRRRDALTRHEAWDKEVAARLEDLGMAVGAPPPLE
ncbi:hypothetical protein [Nocardia farcinica]|uniref:hypothetical protein n=1 Tax=Nocardia farcinica TaxID=37329 RepID=UPI003414FF4D